MFTSNFTPPKRILSPSSQWLSQPLFFFLLNRVPGKQGEMGVTGEIGQAWSEFVSKQLFFFS
jgi:hypothetical protein